MVNKRLMKQLVAESYTNGVLDEQKINRIVTHLKHDELKLYVKALKYAEKKATVIIDTPVDLDSDSKKSLQGMFTDKRVVYNVDPALLLGMRISNNDDVYDLSLKRKIDMVERFLEENYD